MALPVSRANLDIELSPLRKFSVYTLEIINFTWRGIDLIVHITRLRRVRVVQHLPVRIDFLIASH